MAIRQMVNDDALCAVSGGVTYNNDFGDHSVYVIGKNGEEPTHTFLKTDKPAVLAIIAATRDQSLTEEENEENIMEALINSPYLSPL